MTQPVKRSEIGRQACRHADRPRPLVDNIRERFAIRPDKDMVGRPGIVFEEFPRLIVQGDFLRYAALGVPNMDESPVKVDVLPFQFPPLAFSGFGLMDRSAIPVWNRTFVGHENVRSNNSAMAFLPFSWRNLVPVPAKCGWLMTGSFPLSRSTQSD
jgi:hypothetical protein